MKTKYQVLLLCFAVAIATIIVFRTVHTGKQTNIRFSENHDELILTAEFPKEKSGMVYNFLKTRLRLYNLSGLGRLEIRQYNTPDGKLSFYIKSRLQHFRILMERKSNSPEACETLKRTSEELKILLTS